MYGLFTRIGAGAVISAGLSVLGISYLCTQDASNHSTDHPAAVVAAVQADAALGAAVVPGSHGAGGGNTGVTTSPASAGNPGSGSTPGSSPEAPDCGCAANNPSLVNVKPDVDVDVDVDVKLPGTDVDAPGLVGGVLGTVGTVVDGVLPDCGCTSGGPTAIVPLPVLGH
jgi:hypothetical protein